MTNRVRLVTHPLWQTMVLALAVTAPVSAIDIRVTIENLTPEGSVALSPFSLAAHNGSFDAFNSGSAANSGIEAIAELGDGTAWMSMAKSADANAVTDVLRATTGGFGPGIFLPGGSGSVTLQLDPLKNRYLSYGAMVVPSNDAFLGNDSPTAIELFDASGNFVGQPITLSGNRIWDAGTEVNQLLGAAYVVGQTATDGVNENGLVHTVNLPDQFSPYVGSASPSGGMFHSVPASTSPVARISFQVVPEPTHPILGLLLLLGSVMPRRR